MTDLWVPTTDLHYHLDAMTPRSIYLVSQTFDLPFSNMTTQQIAERVQVTPGPDTTWNEWYAVHTAARDAVFHHPNVFYYVARTAAIAALQEGLDARVMRFSTSMPVYCFRHMYGREPDFHDTGDRFAFLSLLSAVTDQLILGFESIETPVKVPLVFSLSCQDKFRPVLPEIVEEMRQYGRNIAGIDLTNEQVHRLPGEYAKHVDTLRTAGMEVLTIHVAEKYSAKGEDHQGRRVYSPEERILSALKMKPDLLGHATWAVESNTSLRAIKESDAVIELCPSAHMYHEVFLRDQSWGPFSVFHTWGIPVTFNSDTPGTYVGGSLASEYELMQRRYNLSVEDLQDIDAVAAVTFNRLYA